MKLRRMAFLVTLFLITGCTQATPMGNSQWIDRLIGKYQSEPVGNPPRSIWKYEYESQVVYYVPAQCCDMYSALYDSGGNFLCAPDGGITGKGDGKCPDFFTERSNELLIWQDARAH